MTSFNIKISAFGAEKKEHTGSNNKGNERDNTQKHFGLILPTMTNSLSENSRYATFSAKGA